MMGISGPSARVRCWGAGRFWTGSGGRRFAREALVALGEARPHE